MDNNQNVKITAENKKVDRYEGLDPNSVNKGAESYFDGGLFGFIGWGILAIIVTVITLGFGAPWAACMLYSYQFKHTVYSGNRLKFRGKGGSLFLNNLKWLFFTIITLGIYSLFVPVKKAKWIISNLYCEDGNSAEGSSYFDGNTLQLIGLNILTTILTLISFGILYPFTVCMECRWINKHTVISNKKLVFTGSALSLWWNYIKWTFFTIITLGIFSLWLPIVELKWQTKNTHMQSVIEKDYKKDKSIWLVIPLLILTATLFGFTIYKVSQINYDDIGIKLKAMNIAAVVAEKFDKDFQSDNIRYNMYKELKDKYDAGEISFDEYDKYMDKYDLYNVKDPGLKYLVDGPVGGDGDITPIKNKKDE